MRLSGRSACSDAVAASPPTGISPPGSMRCQRSSSATADASDPSASIGSSCGKPNAPTTDGDSEVASAGRTRSSAYGFDDGGHGAGCNPAARNVWMSPPVITPATAGVPAIPAAPAAGDGIITPGIGCPSYTGTAAGPRGAGGAAPLARRAQPQPAARSARPVMAPPARATRPRAVQQASRRKPVPPQAPPRARTPAGPRY